VQTSSIVTHRTLGPKDRAGIQELAANIKKHGLRRPILVRDDMSLIDGLRRLEAVKSLNRSEIEATVSDDLDEVLRIVESVHGDGGEDPHTITPRRMYEFQLTFSEMAKDRNREIRARGLWRSENRPADMPELGPLRVRVARALNMPYEGFISRVSKVYRQADKGNALAKELVVRLDAGEITIAQAYRTLEQERLNGVVADVDEQRHMVEMAVRNLDIVIKGLRKLKVPTNLPPEELSPLVEQLRTHRSNLTVMVSTLTRELREINE